MAETTRIMREARDTIADHASTIKDDFHEVGDATRRMASDGAAALRGTASQFVEQGRETAKAVGENLQTRVQNQPLESLLVAGAVGFLLGVFWLRR